MNVSEGEREAKAFCEFFAGIGLVRAGLEDSGWVCVYANDIDEKKRELYLGRFGDDGHFHLGDVWSTDEVLGRSLGSPFLATASFPCVDLSLAGNWLGFEGTRSSTFFGFARVLDRMGSRRPRLVMLENVTGFIASRNGQDFAIVARTLGELGYWLDAFVLDAKHFVPQSRPRVFVIGIHDSIEPTLAARQSRDDAPSNAWLDSMEMAGPELRPRKLVELMRATRLQTGWSALGLRPPAPAPDRLDLSALIDLDEDQDWWDEAGVRKHYLMMSDRHRKRVDEMLADGGRYVGTIFRRNRAGKTHAEIRFDGMAGCLRTPKGGSARQIVIAIADGSLRMRWMLPREYARLQGAGDFPLAANVIQNLHGFGDAVCVPAIRWIDENVLTPIFEETAAIRR